VCCRVLQCVAVCCSVLQCILNASHAHNTHTIYTSHIANMYTTYTHPYIYIYIYIHIYIYISYKYAYRTHIDKVYMCIYIYIYFAYTGHILTTGFGNYMALPLMRLATHEAECLTSQKQPEILTMAQATMWCKDIMRVLSLRSVSVFVSLSHIFAYVFPLTSSLSRYLAFSLSLSRSLSLFLLRFLFSLSLSLSLFSP